MKLPPDLALEGKTGIQIASEIDSGFLFLEQGVQLPIALTIETNRGPLMEMECELTADIAFGQGEILVGEPVLKTLREFAGLVDGIVNSFLSAGVLKK